MTRARDIADQQDNLGGAVAPWVAGKNFVLNGSFDIWQRGTSLATTLYPYTADRWIGGRGGGVSGGTVSRQVTGDTTNLPHIQYCARVQRDNGNTSTATSNFGTPLETINSIPLAGKTVTLSFYARRGSNFSGANNQIQVYLATGTGTDQNVFNPGYTGLVNAINGENATLTTTWQRFNFTGTLNSNITEIAPYFNASYTGTAGANDYYEITGVQLEVGSVATPFSRAGGSIGGELSLCQRYYWRANAQGVFSYFGWGISTGNTGAGCIISLPVTLRTTPTSVDYSTLSLYNGSANFPITNLIIDWPSNNQVGLAATVASGLTISTMYRLLANNSTSAYIGVSAEL